MHDVIRDYLRDELGGARLAELHQVLLDAVAGDLPKAAPVAAGADMVTAWWELPEAARYLWEHLIGHLLAAERPAEAGELAADLRWVGARLQFGPAGPSADLALIGTPRTERLRRVLGQAAHLLTPTHPAHSLIDILYGKVSHDPEWGNQAQALAPTRKLPALINNWPRSDQPDPALRRILAGHTNGVTAVAIAPDGTWLATASQDNSARIWDAATGSAIAVMRVHGSLHHCAMSPSGQSLAVAGQAGLYMFTFKP